MTTLLLLAILAATVWSAHKGLERDSPSMAILAFLLLVIFATLAGHVVPH